MDVLGDAEDQEADEPGHGEHTQHPAGPKNAAVVPITSTVSPWAISPHCSRPAASAANAAPTTSHGAAASNTPYTIAGPKPLALSAPSKT